MPKWIHDRAEHILAKNPSMDKSKAFAIATLQSHSLGKSPKGYGTAEGKQTAKSKYPTPKDDKKTANPGGLDSPKMDKKAYTMQELAALSTLPAAAAGGVAGYRKGGVEGALRGAAGAGLGGLAGGVGGAAVGGNRTIAPALLASPTMALAGYGAATAGMKKKAYEEALLEEFEEITKAGFQVSQYSGPLSYGPFKMVSGLPNKPAPSIYANPTQKQGGELEEKKAGAMTPTGLTPASRLASAKRIGMPKVTQAAGPSIAQIAKPTGFGKPLAGAIKGL